MSWLRRDGVALFYEEAGVGEPPMLLVHGMACDHTHLTLLSLPSYDNISTCVRSKRLGGSKQVT